MSRQNDSDFPQSELDMIEHAMGSMMQGTLSMLFRTLLEPDNNTTRVTFESNDDPSGMIGDGSDFRKLANKSRQNRGLPAEQTVPEAPRTLMTREPELNDSPMMNPPMANILQFMFGNSAGQFEPASNNAGTLLDLMMPDDHLFNNMDPETVARPNQNGHVDPSQGGSSFSFSSTSQRRIVKPDGTEETHYACTQNGITETVKRIKYPDGSIDEVKETGNGTNRGGLFSSSHPPAISFHGQSDEQRHPGVLSSMWRRFFGQS
ncbi:hypothetical protein BJV82DRAFT_600312 [Fennellomyces sp. T-0311]|nr:hypothetical protein BJV82DRAFT_600312 [Fennellomyces sp. T-0311]